MSEIRRSHFSDFLITLGTVFKDNLESFEKTADVAGADMQRTLQMRKE